MRVTYNQLITGDSNFSNLDLPDTDCTLNTPHRIVSYRNYIRWYELLSFTYKCVVRTVHTSAGYAN